jgi:hypothetical protein
MRASLFLYIAAITVITNPLNGADAPLDPRLNFALTNEATAAMTAAAAQWASVRNIDFYAKIRASYWSNAVVTIGPMNSICHWTVRDYLCSQWKAAFNPRCVRGSGTNFSTRIETTAYDGTTAAYLREAMLDKTGKMSFSPVGRIFALRNLEEDPLLMLNPLQFTFPRILTYVRVDPFTAKGEFPQGFFSAAADPKSNQIVWTIRNLTFGELDKIYLEKRPSGVLIVKKLEIFGRGMTFEPSPNPTRIITADDYEAVKPGGPEMPTAIHEQRFENGKLSYDKTMTVNSLTTLPSVGPGAYTLAFPKRTRVLDSRFGQLFVVGDDAESTVKSIKKAETPPFGNAPQ